MLIIVDDREPADVVQAVERAYSNDTVLTKRLRVGDLRIGPLTVERKTVQDAINGLFSGHLMRQVVDLMTLCARPILCVHMAHEQLDPEQYRILEERLKTINLVLPTYLFGSLDDLLSWTADRAKYLRTGEWFSYVKRPVRVRESSSSVVAGLYAGFPHVSNERADALAEAYPHPAELVLAVMGRSQPYVAEVSPAGSGAAGTQERSPQHTLRADSGYRASSSWSKAVPGVGPQTARCIEEVLTHGTHNHRRGRKVTK